MIILSQVPPGFVSNSSSPRGEVNSMTEYAERLNNSNSVCNALQTQVNSLQGNFRIFIRLFVFLHDSDRIELFELFSFCFP